MAQESPAPEPEDNATSKPKQQMSVLQTLAGCGVLTLLAALLVGGCVGLLALLDSEDGPAAATPRSRPSQSPCPTEVEQEYFAQLGGEWISAMTLVEMYGEELEAVGETPGVVVNEDWKYARETDVIGIEGALDRLILIEAPGSVADIDRQVEEVARLLNDAVWTINSGIQDFDTDMLDLGTARLEQVRPKILAVGEARLTFCE